MTTFRFTVGNGVQTAGANDHAFDTDTATADTLIVDRGSGVGATGAGALGALLGNQKAWKVSVNGIVSSGLSDGLVLALNNPDVSTIEVGKTGWVLGAGFGMRIESQATINNAGKIEGGEVAIFLSGSGKHTVKNTGWVVAGDYAIRDDTGVSDDTVTNSGQMDGEVSLEGGADALINSGTISGEVAMGGGDDALTNSKSISGGVRLGLGHDTMTNSGTIGDIVFAGDGNDTIRNSGTFIDDINLGDGLNTLTNTGRIGDDVVGGSDKDIVKNTGVIAGQVNLGAGDDVFTGGNLQEAVVDGAGSDTVKLGGGEDTYYATYFAGVDGTDTIDGGAGGDVYVATSATSGVRINLDKIAHDCSPIAPGVNLVAANTATGADIAGAFKDTITNFESAAGGSGADVIYGNAFANLVYGLGDDDFLAGYGGHDLLEGGDGLDSLFGGAGRDYLAGGADSDTFWFVAVTDSGITETTRDMILDFESGDHIDLSRIDANTKNGPADDGFAFIGTDVALAGVAGQLRAVTSADGQIVEGDVNGDGKADFSIALYDPTHSYTLTQADFIL